MDTDTFVSLALATPSIAILAGYVLYGFARLIGGLASTPVTPDLDRAVTMMAVASALSDHHRR